MKPQESRGERKCKIIKSAWNDQSVHFKSLSILRVNNDMEIYAKLDLTSYIDTRVWDVQFADLFTPDLRYRYRLAILFVTDVTRFEGDDSITFVS